MAWAFTYYYGHLRDFDPKMGGGGGVEGGICFVQATLVSYVHNST